MPLVSVIINCVNHEKFIVEAIRSVEEQSYKNIEIIVLDNGSTDNSLKTISNYLQNKPHIQLIHWENTQPLTIAFNRMVKLSKGDYLIDLSGDDVLLPKCIEKQMIAFQNASNEVGLVFGNAYNTDENGTKLSPYFLVDEQGKVLDKGLFKTDYYRLLGSGINLCSVSSMMKRSHFEALGGYDESLFFEDLDYWFRLARKYKILFIDDFLVKKRKVAHSLGTSIVEKDSYSKKIHASLYTIYHRAINYNNKTENKQLLKRIHYSMYICFSNKLWYELLKYFYLEIKCRWRILRKI